VNHRARNRFLTFLAESGSLRTIADADQTIAAQPDVQSPTLLGDATNGILSNAAGLTYFFDRDAKTELTGPAYEGMRLFLKPPYDTEQAVQHIEQWRRKAKE
jgi:multiple sugar transport system substrate-binding protein